MSLTHRPGHFNVAGLPLFIWAAERDRMAPQNPAYAVRTLARRHGLPPARARLVAGLAGYPTEGELT